MRDEPWNSGASKSGADAQALIVGLGPVGAVLAVLLARRGLQVVIVERDPAPYPLPRAVAADDEVLRVLCALPGLDDLLDQVNGVQRAAFVDAGRAVLAEMAFGETSLGMPGLAFFHQPTLEAALRRAVAGFPRVTVVPGSVIGLAQDPGRVTVRLAGGEVITAGYAIGCDGASSIVREAIGAAFSGRSWSAPWLVVDVETEEPLPDLPYFSYVCDPARPAVTMPMPGGHRWEWMVLPGDDPAELASPASVRALLARDVDPNRVRVVRRAIYTYHARIAATWRRGRVLLAGDAAHCMPPFAGQGFGAGVRDAAALAWRLDEVLRGLAAPSLLDGYERERRPHVRTMTRLALLAGRLLQPTSDSGALAARTLLRALDRAPVVGPAFRAGRARPPVRLARAGLLPAARLRRAGGALPNPRVRTLDGRVRRLDRLVEDRWAVVAAGTDPRGRLPGRLAQWLAGRSVAAFSIVPPGGLRQVAALGCPAVEDLDGTLLSVLGRPDTGRIALARPDRFLVGVERPERLLPALAALYGGLP